MGVHCLLGGEGMNNEAEDWGHGDCTVCDEARHPTQKWQSEHYTLSPDTWCWVSDGERVWPAMYDPSAAGNWTNADTWEDFSKEVKYFIPLETPDAPKSCPADQF